MPGPDFRQDPIVYANQVAIATGSPEAKLAVGDTTNFPDMTYAVLAAGKSPDAATPVLFYLRNAREGAPVAWFFYARKDATTDLGGQIRFEPLTGLYIDATGSHVNNQLVLKPDGKVGVGMVPVSEKLEVNGNVKAAGTVISQSPGVNASLQRDVDTDYLALSGGRERVGSGGLIQLIGNAFAGIGGSLQFILGKASAEAKHRFYNSALQEVASIDNSGKLTLEGPIGKIHGEDKVGIASNGYQDLIFNYGGQAGHGVVLWMWGAPQGGGDQGGGTQKMRLEVDGSLYINQNLALRNDGVANSCYYA